MLLKISQKFTRKHLYRSLIPLYAYYNFIKKRLKKKCFLVHFVKFLRTHQATTSDCVIIKIIIMKEQNLEKTTFLLKALQKRFLLLLMLLLVFVKNYVYY